MLVADTETRNETPASVWLWGVSTLDKNIIGLGYDMASFFEFLKKEYDDEYFFHNAKFDCSFIADYGFRHGYKIEPMLNKVGMLFSMSIWVEGRKIRFYDSYKFAKGSLEKIAESLKLEYRKGKMDYDKPRPIGYRPDEGEMDYFRADLFMLAEVVEKYMARSTVKTLPARSYASFVSMFGPDKKAAESAYYNRFPRIGGELYKELHLYYRGGVVYCHDRAKGYKGPSSVWDVNSEYPYVMMSAILPHGSPMPFKGKPRDYAYYPLYLIHVQAVFKLKDGKVPFLYSHDGTIGGDGLLTEKLEMYDLWITSMEYKRFMSNYEVYYIEYIGGYYFRGRVIPELVQYVKFWADKKRDATTPFDRQEAKDHLNTISGKWGASPERMKYTPYLDDNNALRYKGEPMAERYFDALYIPLSIFILAYARLFITYYANKNYDRLLYIDTDSLHLIGHEVGKDLPIGIEIGQLKLEHDAVASRYFGVKSYALEEKISLTFAIKGLPKKSYDLDTFTNTSKCLETYALGRKTRIVVKMSGLHEPRLYEAGKEVNITKLEDLDGAKYIDFKVKRAKIVEGGTIICDQIIRKKLG